MGKHSIAVIKGDGIGVDVVDEALKVLDALADKHDIKWKFVEFPWSSEYYFEHGEMMPSDGVEQLRSFDAIFLGAVGHPEVQDHITLNGLLLPIRRAFDQYACVRPSVLLPGVDSPLKRRQTIRHRHDRGAREHRGRVRQRRWIPISGLSRAR